MVRTAKDAISRALDTAIKSIEHKPILARLKDEEPEISSIQEADGPEFLNYQPAIVTRLVRIRKTNATLALVEFADGCIALAAADGSEKSGDNVLIGCRTVSKNPYVFEPMVVKVLKNADCRIYDAFKARSGNNTIKNLKSREEDSISYIG